MDEATVNAITQVASGLTTNAVLLLWLIHEIKQAKHAKERLEKFHDKEREMRERGESTSGD